MKSATAAGARTRRARARRSREQAVLVLSLAAVLGACTEDEPRMTGYVEGEERILRSEVAGRIRTVPHVEGERVAPGDPVAELDASDIDATIAT
jgi:multidrug efflux pump subunit AcrA (membrane-fusion protein)